MLRHKYSEDLTAVVALGEEVKTRNAEVVFAYKCDIHKQGTVRLPTKLH